MRLVEGASHAAGWFGKIADEIFSGPQQPELLLQGGAYGTLFHARATRLLPIAAHAIFDLFRIDGPIVKLGHLADCPAHNGRFSQRAAAAIALAFIRDCGKHRKLGEALDFLFDQLGGDRSQEESWCDIEQNADTIQGGNDEAGPISLARIEVPGRLSLEQRPEAREREIASATSWC